MIILLRKIEHDARTDCSSTMASNPTSDQTDPAVLEQWAQLGVYGWADPSDPLEVDFAHTSRLTFNRDSGCYEQVSFTGESDEDRRPINPSSTVGIRGRGSLGKWGVNRASHLIIWRRRLTGAIQILFVRSNSNETFRLPGGFIMGNESALVSAKKHLVSRYVSEFAAIKNVSLPRAQVVCGAYIRRWLENLLMEAGNESVSLRGVVNDPRNTDNAWVESTIYFINVPFAILKSADPIDTLKSDGCSWMDLSTALESNINPMHKDFVLRSFASLDTEWSTVLVIGILIIMMVITIMVARDSHSEVQYIQEFYSFNLDH